jgi:hypothetical protein
MALMLDAPKLMAVDGSSTLQMQQLVRTVAPLVGEVGGSAPHEVTGDPIANLMRGGFPVAVALIRAKLCYQQKCRYVAMPKQLAMLGTVGPTRPEDGVALTILYLVALPGSKVRSAVRRRRRCPRLPRLARPTPPRPRPATAPRPRHRPRPRPTPTNCVPLSSTA